MYAIKMKFLVLFVVMLAWSGLSFSAARVVHAAELLQPMSEDVADRPIAPDFSLLNLDDEPVALSDFKGKVVIVNFWATWCPPCRYEMPSMQRAWEKLQEKDVMMLAVHVGGKSDKIWAFVGDYEITFPVLIDPKSKTADAWPLKGLPTTFVIDPKGRIAYRAIGGREWDDEELLKTVYALQK